MPDTDIGQSTASDLTNTIVDFSVDPATTDGALGHGETEWQMEDWEKNYGYYLEISGLQIAIDAKANWTMGAGFEADRMTILQLSTIKGNGKDSFNTIIGNMIRTYTIGGDSFAEIMRDDKNLLINLKPLSPDSIKIIQDKKGRIKRYEQVNRNKKVIKKFKPVEILHLSRKRIADSIHGISVIPAVRSIIDAEQEAMADWRKVLHWNVRPRWKIQLDTDDPTKISAFKAKYDEANAKGENFYIPKGTVEVEVLGVAPNANLNPLPWIVLLNDKFFQTVNVPQIIVGNAKEFTDASGKIVYLSYEQSVKGEQLYVEEQLLGQLNISIQLTFPATLQNELISDRDKNPISSAAEPNDTTEKLEGKE